LYLLLFLVNTGVEKLSGVALGLGSGVLGVSCEIEIAETFFKASGMSSEVPACSEDVVASLFSDIVFNIFFPASFVYNNQINFKYCPVFNRFYFIVSLDFLNGRH
jgi:hypothetical protein